MIKFHNTGIPRPSGEWEPSKSHKALREAGIVHNPRSPNKTIDWRTYHELVKAPEYFGMDLTHLTPEKAAKVMGGKHYKYNPSEGGHGIPEDNDAAIAKMFREGVFYINKKKGVTVFKIGGVAYKAKRYYKDADDDVIGKLAAMADMCGITSKRIEGIMAVDSSLTYKNALLYAVAYEASAPALVYALECLPVKYTE